MTLEDEDVVAMGTLNPAVTQELPSRYDIPELPLIAHLFCIVPTSAERVAFHASV